MSIDPKVLEKIVRNALSGKGAHVEAKKVLEGMDWKAAGARPKNAPHSIFQLLNHIVFWQEWVVKWLDGEKPPVPKHASGSWPGGTGPSDSKEWEQAVKRFGKCLNDLRRRVREADLVSKGRRKSRLEMLHTIASHNSYHIGQIVQVRQMLGAWPPPSGGLSW
jgi:uncharacterized damage-inducible protein DinB